MSINPNHNADRNPNAQHGFLQFLTKMSELASQYTRNHQLRQIRSISKAESLLASFHRLPVLPRFAVFFERDFLALLVARWMRFTAVCAHRPQM